MGASRIVRENQRYLDRVRRSMDAEKAARIERQRLREEKQWVRDQRQQERNAHRDRHIESNSVAYAAFWCQTTGVAVPGLIRSIKTGVPSNVPASVRPPAVKVFDTTQRRSYEMLLVDMIKMVMDRDFPLLEPCGGDQVPWTDTLLVPTGIYEFVAQAWHEAR